MRMIVCGIVMVVLMVACTTAYGDGWNLGLHSLDVLMDETASIGKARVGVLEKGNLEVGPCAEYFGESQSAVWGAGAYAKLSVDPNTSYPFRDAIVGVIDWANDVGLEVGYPYLLGELMAVDYTEDAGVVAAPGVGITVADLLLVEYLYRWPDGGAIDDGG